jgi:methyl-accepting chemotaxis protein PixJ
MSHNGDSLFTRLNRPLFGGQRQKTGEASQPPLQTSTVEVSGLRQVQPSLPQVPPTKSFGLEPLASSDPQEISPLQNAPREEKKVEKKPEKTVEKSMTTDQPEEISSNTLLQVINFTQQLDPMPDLPGVLAWAVQDIRRILGVDRVLIYRLLSETTGYVEAESLKRGYTPALGETLPLTLFGVDELAELGIFLSMDGTNLTPYQTQLWNRFQIKNSLSLCLFISGQPWGLLVLHRCQNATPWAEKTMSLIYHLSQGITLKLQSLLTEEYVNQQLSAQAQEIESHTQEIVKQVEREINLSRLGSQVGELVLEGWQQQGVNLLSLFRDVTRQIRQILEVDRAAIYRFAPDWSGEFIAESVGSEWISVLDEQQQDEYLQRNTTTNDRCILKKLAAPARADVDTYLKNTQGGDYTRGKLYTQVDDIYAMNFDPCYIRRLEKYQAKAYIIVPLFQGSKAWGLLAVYQNRGSRKWQPAEVTILQTIATQMGLALRQEEYITQINQQSNQLTQQAEREKTKAALVSRIRQSLDLDTLFQVATEETRRVINTDRAIVYQFNPDWSGQVVAESVGSGWVSLLIEQEKEAILKGDRIQNNRCILRKWSTGDITEVDTYLQKTQGSRYRQGATATAIADIYAAQFPECYIKSLEKYQAKAYVIAPIFQGTTLWGLLGVYQNSGTREWQDADIELITQLAEQLGVAIQQASYLEQAQRQAEREKTKASLVSRIRESLDLDALFQIATQETRRVVNTDRAIVYQFNPDWSGQVIAESVGSGWVSLLVEQEKEAILKGDRIQTNRCILRKWASGDITEVDTYLQKTQGRRYREGGGVTAISDIYAAQFPECYIKSLEKYQAKAYVIAPIFQGTTLWGLLGVYHNAGPRPWETDDIELITQIAEQLGVAIQQAEYVDQMQQQAKILTETADRERGLTNLIQQIRRSSDLEVIFNTAVQEARFIFKSDRVALYRFNADFSGNFIAESVGPGWNRLVGTSVKDTYLEKHQGGRYAQNEVHVISDIYAANFDRCHLDLLEGFQARAYVIAPIFVGETLWGLLAIYQNSGPRYWQEEEVRLSRQISEQLGIALSQAKFLEQIQAQSQQLTEAANREKIAKENLQREVIQLLSSVRPILGGDLSIRVPVSETEVGTIADAYNNTIQSLRKLAIQVQAIAQEVTLTSQNSEASVTQLSQQAQRQSEEISQALIQIEAMVESTQAVARNAQDVQQSVQQAEKQVAHGEEAMLRTVEAIQKIRETVAETAKKIKRLSESSQKISKVVNLISTFATQTNLLALNAAIEATRAGEYGRGFAVVADEVRSLARQSANATDEIEKLVQEIQQETNQVTAAMETGIQQVVEGTDLVAETRKEIGSIRQATAEIRERVNNINEATQRQTQQSQQVTQAMDAVAAIANCTSADAIQVANTFQTLLKTAAALQESVGQFKVN